MKFEEIICQVKKTQEFSMNTKMGYAGITDSDGRWVRLFKIKGSEFEEVDVKGMVKMISEYLAKHVTLEKLLNDKILHKPLETILQLSERVKAEGKVEEHKGCYYLLVKGKQGSALELEL